MADKSAEVQRIEKDSRLSEAHIRLAGNADFKVHMEWLAELLTDRLIQGAMQDGNDVYRGQGSSRELMNIIQTVDTAPDIRAKIALSVSQRVRGLRQ